MDDALIRPGRVDVKHFIGYATRYQIENMFLNFYPDANQQLAQAFADRLISFNKQISSAQIQGFFMLHKNQPQTAFENVEFFNK